MSIDGVVLFSGGLDSVLAARLLMDQGLNVLCLHYVSPFFGSASSKERWERLYGIEIEVGDAGPRMVEMLASWPEHGFGKGMNPCVDCKITMLGLARRRMRELGAKFVATGEVIGQRPMSQRRDIMNRIRHKAEVDDWLLRPLCAQLLDPTPVEESGLVDRSRLLRISGRGRGEQLALAKSYGFSEIPSPGGGCLLTERENVCHYWPLRTHRPSATVQDYRLAAWGRQLWRIDGGEARWMIVARNNRDNDRLRQAFRERDLLMGLCDYPGPIALLRDGRDWPRDDLEKAAAQFLSYAPKASGLDEARVWVKDTEGESGVLRAAPHNDRVFFTRPTWEQVKEEKHRLASRREAALNEEREREREARRLAREAGEAVAEPAPDDIPDFSRSGE